MIDDPLFKPLTIKKFTLKNRFVMPAMQRGFAANFSPTPQMATYMQRCAEGGMALIISEGTSPDHPSAYWQPVFCTIGRANRDVWARVIHDVKHAGATMLVQLWHAGSSRVVDPSSRYAAFPSLSPSGLVQKGRANGIAMTKQDLVDIREAFVEAALLAKELGADGVELHACHGYFLDQFLWHETNIRDDEYGGPTLAERSRYPAEIVAAIRRAAGDDFLISFRFSQWKEVDYEARVADAPEDLRPLIERLEQAGVDLFHASTRRFDKPAFPHLHPTRSLGGWVKSMTSLPVITLGSVGLNNDVTANLFHSEDPQLQVEQDLEKLRTSMEAGEFDLIGIGRAQIANPEFVNIVKANKLGCLVTFDRKNHLKEFAIDHEASVVDLSSTI